MTPQEKKRLSYERDRRNTYGENDKSSRKNIPRGKRLASRAGRRSASVALVGIRGHLDPFGVVDGYGDPGAVDGTLADRVEQRIAGRRLPRFRKWRDTPLGDVVAYQMGRRVEVDPAGAAVADERIRRVEYRLGRRVVPDRAGIAPWIHSLAMIDRQIRLHDGDRLRDRVARRLAEVRRAERAGAFTPYDVALRNARFIAWLHRDGIAAAVADLLPPVEAVVRECLDRIPVSERAVRAARPVDARLIGDAFRLVDAAGRLSAHVTDPGIATRLRAWRRLRRKP
jgi:hypothetical protein